MVCCRIKDYREVLYMSLGFSLLEYNACFRRRGLQRCIAWLRKKNKCNLKTELEMNFWGR
jgi:hypothetical protein